MSAQSWPYHDGYANLAAAIINSGVKCHDTEFLNSDWCELLKEMCNLDDQLYAEKNVDQSIMMYSYGGKQYER